MLQMLWLEVENKHRCKKCNHWTNPEIKVRKTIPAEIIDGKVFYLNQRVQILERTCPNCDGVIHLSTEEFIA